MNFLADGRGLLGFFLVLVENPFERGAVAESVIPQRGFELRGAARLSDRYVSDVADGNEGQTSRNQTTSRVIE